MKKALMTSLGVLLFTFFVVSPIFSKVNADGVCQPIYGGGEQCLNTQWYINKMVLNPSTNSYVDNLTLSDPKFKPGDSVQFRIQVTNTGTATLGVIKVTDTLPNYLDWTTVQAPMNVDLATGKVTFEVNSLNPGQTKEVFISARVKSTAALPAVKNTLCPINFVSAHTDNVGDVSDQSQFCIQKSVTGVTAVPKTGPEETMILGLGGLFSGGLFLIKKTRRMIG